MSSQEPMEIDADAGDNQIDESLYSRQLYVLGFEAMERMRNAKVLIAGMGGLGVEVAKNVILAGVKSVTVQDTAFVTLADLSSQFFLRSEDIGKNRASCSQKHLCELNPYVPIDVATDELTSEFVEGYQVVVLTASTLAEQLKLNEVAHEKGIKFIAADTRGLFSQIFCDFGKDFVVQDPDGESPGQVVLSSIDVATGIVTCVDDQRHGFSNDTYVKFVEVEGLDINEKEFKITVKGPYSFSIGENNGVTGSYTGRGLAIEVKKPKVMQFQSMKESIDAPEYFITDFAKMERPAQLHLGYQALHEMVSVHGKVPRPRHGADADELIHIVKSINSTKKVVDEVDEKLLKLFAYGATGQLAPMNAVVGSFTAQEVMKAVSGKFTPMSQWMYFDSTESLPEDESLLTESSCSPIGSRYDAQIAVFGKAGQEVIGRQNYFLVGSGAIGCEMLKNFAMIGLGANGGKITVTDMDTIERSNLNRQFLFRPKDVGSAKSHAGAAAAKVMNPDMNIVAMEDKVAPDTEETFNDDFFTALDGVTNALDNVQARMYMDRRCIYFGLPLFESGTLGTKGNTQVVIPKLTESYSSSVDPPEKEFPSCTLKNFPHQIEHTIQWARDLFEGLFTKLALNASQYQEKGTFVQDLMEQNSAEAVETLEGIIESFVTMKPTTFADCVSWARLRFQALYSNSLKQLLFNFPPDASTSSGAPFWSAPKRCPTPAVFDSDNPLHMDFIVAAANLRAFNFGIEGSRDRALIKEALQAVVVPPFEAQAGVKIQVKENENDNAAPAPAADDVIETLVKKLPARESVAGIKSEAADFEKDDDSNFHIDFITAASNMRATVYGIKNESRHVTKQKAGKIIPAIATTTSLVSGLVMLEMYKQFWGCMNIERFKSGFVNLALPFFGFSEPITVPKNKYNDVEWSLWDRFDIDHDITLGDLVKLFNDKHGLEITMLVYGSSLLYSFFGNKQKKKERMPKPISAVIEDVMQQPLPPHIKNIVVEVCCNDKEGEDAEVPYIKIAIRK